MMNWIGFRAITKPTVRASQRVAWWFACIVLLACPVMAKQAIPEARERDKSFVRVGQYQIHYSAFNSTFIPSTVAEQYKLRRGERYGVVNIAVRDLSTGLPGKASTANVSGYVKNLLSQKTGLKFSVVNEGDAIYYLADFTFSDGELLKFAIDVKPLGSSLSETLNFEQLFYK